MSFSPDSLERLQPLVLTDFSGGMKRNINSEFLQHNQYPFLSNGRNREGKIANVKKALSYAPTLPAGKHQGVYGAGSILVVFIDGLAYYRNFADAMQHKCRQ